MRIAGLLLLLALCARAEEWTGIKAALEEERFDEALAMADEARSAHPRDGLLAWLRAKAVVGVARGLQRARGYPAALAFYERHLDHEVSAYWYGRTCGWAGEEERGLDALRACAVPPERRLEAEMNLLVLLRRYEEIAARAREIGGEEAAAWVEWAEREAAFRDRLAGRARLAALCAFGALLAIAAAAAALLVTLSRRSRRAATS